MSYGVGCLNCDEIKKEVLNHSRVLCSEDIRETQIQPASLDLRLGPEAYLLKASFLPGRDVEVLDKLPYYSLEKIDLSSGAVLDPGRVYLIPLMESFALPHSISALSNPKSSTGRLDIFTRTITNGGVLFDVIPTSYEGPIYLEVCSQSFPILVCQGLSLSQIRFHRYDVNSCAEKDLRRIHSESPLITSGPVIFMQGLGLTVDLTPAQPKAVVGFEARRDSPVLDLSLIAHYDPSDFWNPVYLPKDRNLILTPHHFYIFSSKQTLCIPSFLAAQIRTCDTLFGEFGPHYASFTDPGFGPAKAVLEVRNPSVPFALEDGHKIGRLVCEYLTSETSKPYGCDQTSHYQGQGLKLSKQFKDVRF